jgi:hypothetical protein
VIVDDADSVARLEKFWEKAEAKLRANFSCPIQIKNRLNALKIDRCLLVSPAVAKALRKYVKLDEKMLSAIKVEVEHKTRTVIHNDGKVYDYISKTYVPWETALVDINKGGCTYELYEGDVNGRGWVYQPKFDVIAANGLKGNKNDLIVIEHHGPWKGCKYDKFTNLKEYCQLLKLTIKEPNRHYLIDWTCFKKNDVMNIKKLKYISSFSDKQMAGIYSAFEQLGQNPVIYSQSICNETVAKRMLTEGVRFSGFEATPFGLEMDRIVQERTLVETDESRLVSIKVNLLNAYTEMMIPVTGIDPTTIFTKFADHVNAVKKLVTPIKARIDHVTPIVMKYPMLQFMRNWDGIAIEKTVDYIALIEGLVAK